MKFETFKAGHWQSRYQYKSFEPVPVNHEWTWEDARINVLLESATRALGELNAFSLIVPDVDMFIQMHVIKEAQTSSRIEGTQTSMDEALLPESQILPERRNDWREVQNYIAALNSAIDRLKTLPLSNRLLKEAHLTLMQGVRGEKKQPGEFRTSQNWIGGSNLSDAAFIPLYHESVPDLMSDLERFWHNDAVDVPHLIRAAISHYQFETIHPFLDGNGRVGRLLIPLYLINHKLLAKPSFYLSDFFERNRASYYDALMIVRKNNDLNHWIRFFLSGVRETATKGCEVFRQLLAIRTETEAKIQTLGKRAANAHAAIEALKMTRGNAEKAVLNTERRKNLVLAASQVYEREVELSGSIGEADWKKSTFRLEQEDGSPLIIPMQGSFHEKARESGGHKRDYVFVKGVATYDSWDRLQRVIHVDSLEVIHNYPLVTRFEELALLVNGWHDGLGAAPDKEKLAAIARYLTDAYPEHLPLPAIVPTQEGNLLLEWQTEGDPSVDIELSSFAASFHAFTPNGQDVEKDFSLNNGRDWQQFLSFLSEHIRQEDV